MANAKDREFLAAELKRHVEEEGEILEKYRAFSDKLGEGPLGILVDHIVTEEEMHHFLLRTLSDWLDAPPAPGEPLASLGIDRQEVLSYTRSLQEHEKKTVVECRVLKGRLSSEERDLFETLLDAIALDSEKHQLLLAAVEKLIA